MMACFLTYTGQTIEVTEHDATIAANIPLDIAQGKKRRNRNILHDGSYFERYSLCVHF